MSFVRNFIREEEGQSMVEYGLLLGFIAVAAYAAFSKIGTSLSTGVGNQANTLGQTLK